MKIVQKDPRVPFVLDPDRVETIDRQVTEVVAAMAENLDFEVKAEELAKTIDKAISEIAKKMATKDEKLTPAQEAERLKQLARDSDYMVASSRTPAQLADEKRDELKAAAVKVLEGFHEKKMAGRLAHWQTMCRLDGCEKQPRTSNRPTTSGRKARRRSFMFCPGHVGVRNLIRGADYRQLKSNSNLRVVAEE